jgi:hypothetical protein
VAFLIFTHDVSDQLVSLISNLTRLFAPADYLQTLHFASSWPDMTLWQLPQFQLNETNMNLTPHRAG